MRKYLVKILTNTQEQDASTITAYVPEEGESTRDFDERVKVAYHNILSAYHNADDVLYAVVQIVNEYGNVEIMEIVNHIPEPEPVEV